MYMTVPSYSQDYLVSGVVPVVGAPDVCAGVLTKGASGRHYGELKIVDPFQSLDRAAPRDDHITMPASAFPSSVVDPVAPCSVVEAGSYREGQYRANGGRIWVEGTAIAAPVEIVVMQRRRR